MLLTPLEGDLLRSFAKSFITENVMFVLISFFNPSTHSSIHSLNFLSFYYINMQKVVEIHVSKT